MELYVVSIFWLRSDTSGTFSLYFAQPLYQFERPTLKMHLLLCRTDICSCKRSTKVSLMLNNPFLAPSLCKLNHISAFSSRLARKSLQTAYSLQGKLCFFWSDPRLVNFNITEISIKTARVSRLYFRFLWLCFKIFLMNACVIF